MKYYLSFFLFAITFNSISQCWIKISTSESSFGIKGDGTLWAWGKNQYGALGDGTTIDKNTPTQIGSDSNWADIDSNSNNTLALKTDGTLWVWGYNTYGHLGLANQNMYTIPIQLGVDNDWIDISRGVHGRLAIKSNHSLWGWGTNYMGALAIGPVISGSDATVLIPTQTGNGTNDWKKAVYKGCCFTKMIKLNGTLWGQGWAGSGNLSDGNTAEHLYNEPVQMGVDSDWNSVDTSYFTLAIKNNGTLWGCGSNGAGQIGDGTTINRSTLTATGLGINWTSISTGLNYALGISTEGNLYAWGYNDNGQLGDGTFIEKHIPTLIGSACSLSNSEFSNYNNLVAYPNPTKDRANINYVMTENETVTFSVYNLIGQLIYQKEVQSARGENNEFIDLSKLAEDVYIVSIKGTLFSAQTKITKVR
jgi:alpha-tubulin suppressor-like RCC1 family protein